MSYSASHLTKNFTRSDAVYDEDYSRGRKDNTAQNLNVFRKMALNLLRFADFSHITTKKLSFNNAFFCMRPFAVSVSPNGLQVLGDIVVPFEQIGHLPVVAHQVIAKVYRTAAHFKGVD